ncbi:hypothetical protein EDD16DRAFT_1527214 [Pisolithus croceorrhizus]|nr:hypothetical protein EDD16DRAFT_1527214 [Pisolithus croceorrhizus]KAI6115415.1 hypothetical protein EV401DRAFT_1889571 [Pisolithus croceorrhizus]KAI6164091.1 hypothetical protein EDD17DRAFT_1506943 [Pisolithus thermaeus]
MGDEVIGTSFACEKFISGTCSNGKDGWNIVFMGDDKVRNDPSNSLDTSNDDIIPTDTVKDSRYRQDELGEEAVSVWLGICTMSSAPGTCILNMVNNVIYIKVTGSLSNQYSVPSIKKFVLCLKDTGNAILPPERKYMLEEEALDEVYKGTISIQETFTRVMDLPLLKDSNDSLKMEHVKAKDINGLSLLSPPCVTLLGKPEPRPGKFNKALAIYIIPFDPIDIPMQHAKRKASIDRSAGSIPEYAKLEIS